MIEAAGLTKQYGSITAVDGLSFTVPPGKITGFLGPNGAGKSTTMRMILGLDAPSAGSVTIDAYCMPDTAGRCGRSAPCWTPGHSPPGAVPEITCGGWR